MTALLPIAADAPMAGPMGGASRRAYVGARTRQRAYAREGGTPR
jgi:hypothetical protein